MNQNVVHVAKTPWESLQLKTSCFESIAENARSAAESFKAYANSVVAIQESCRRISEAVQKCEGSPIKKMNQAIQAWETSVENLNRSLKSVADGFKLNIEMPSFPQIEFECGMWGIKKPRSDSTCSHHTDESRIRRDDDQTTKTSTRMRNNPSDTNTIPKNAYWRIKKSIIIDNFRSAASGLFCDSVREIIMLIISTITDSSVTHLLTANFLIMLLCFEPMRRAKVSIIDHHATIGESNEKPHEHTDAE